MRSADGQNGPLPHVLITEDEPHFARFLEMLLEDEELRVSVARTGHEALERIREDTSLSLVILDIMLPEMTGLEVLRAARQLESGRSLPIMILTAKGDTVARRKAVELGATEFRTKPFSPRKLLARIREICEMPAAAGG